MTKAIAFTVHPVADLQRAVDYYRYILDLGEPAVFNSERWAEFDIGGSTFAVATGGEEIGIPVGSAFAIGFEVDDLEAVHKKIESRGQEAGEIFEAPNCFTFFASDPDGNRFAIHKLK